ncbi:MAG: ATP synthase subunit delta [Gemmatales bacterium]|nr:MAG: ATP synthase subunit delta [Gemmatales bacterium]
MNADANLPEITADIGLQSVARVYAAALLRAAEKQHQVDQVIDELHSLVHDVYQAEPTLEKVLASSAISREQKRPLIQKAFAGKASDLFVCFLNVLNDHDRLDLVRLILVEVRQLQDERARRVRVHVRTAVPLPDDQRQRLIDVARNRLQLEPLLETRVDPDILGGIIIRIGDYVYDSSVKTRLEEIKKHLIERSSHGIQSRRNRLRD